MPPEHTVSIKVWDLPVRIFHWAIVVLLVLQVTTGEIGGGVMALHLIGGYAILVLLVFRVLWGFAGSTHARFASFIAGPVATIRFARRLFSRQAVPQVGHNPLGGWSVVAMIVLMLLQAGSGLFANDGDEALGPFAPYVPIDVSNAFTEFHRWNLKLLIVLSALHVVAVLFHWLVKRDNLISAMFTGVKEVPEAAVHE
ncbi:MAG TPA: cytochrome b/b6 domain-containing protein, partial [Usitatibacter sp.]